MNATSIHDPATGAVTLYALFLRALRRHAEAAGSRVFFASHRLLAAELECSAARIPDLMARAEDEGVLLRRPYKNTYRLTLIDQPVWSGQERTAGLIDQAPTAAAANEVPAALEAGSHQDAPGEVIDQILAHMECHVLDQEEEESPRTRVPLHPADQVWLDLGVNPAKLDAIRRWGGTPADFRTAAARKELEGARSPVGAVIAAIERGVALIDWRGWAQEVSGGAGRGAEAEERPRTHQRERPVGRDRHAASRRFASLDYYADLLPDLAAAADLSPAPA